MFFFIMKRCYLPTLWQPGRCHNISFDITVVASRKTVAIWVQTIVCKWIQNLFGWFSQTPIVHNTEVKFLRSWLVIWYRTTKEFENWRNPLKHFIWFAACVLQGLIGGGYWPFPSFLFFLSVCSVVSNMTARPKYNENKKKSV